MLKGKFVTFKRRFCLVVNFSGRASHHTPASNSLSSCPKRLV